MEDVTWLPEETWETIVQHSPIVSVDLVVLADDGVVLGKRRNEPARGEWFVPGGRVHKGERLEAAVARVGRAELGVAVDILERIGVYEHLWEAGDVADAGGKHHVPVAYTVRVVEGELDADDQHEVVEAFASGELPDNLHPYVEEYLSDSSYVEF